MAHETAARANAGLKRYGTEMAIGAVTAGALTGIRIGAEALVAVVDAASLQRLATSGALTEHGFGRVVTRAMTPGLLNDAVRTAIAAGRIVSKVGKYGTPQKHYIGSNGITVVMETQGRNAGKIVTAFWH